MALPVLIYLTVFKSRLGLTNIVLAETGLANQSTAGLTRKVKRVLDDKQELDLQNPAYEHVFRYLVDKKLVGREPRTRGRYANYTLAAGDASWAATVKGSDAPTLPVYQTDLWMADPDVPSTIGVPTPDNVDEVVELSVQLGIISKSTNTWTAAGQVTSALRALNPDGEADNPFLLRAEAAVLLRQVLEADALIVRALIPFLVQAGPTITRPHVAEAFEDIVSAAVQEAKETRTAALQMRDLLAFQKLIREQTKKLERTREKAREKGTGESRAPGVLEHRVSPRLEWLVDLGYLSKEGFAKNSFEYRTTNELRELAETMTAFNYGDRWADDVASVEWHRNPYWKRVRERLPKASNHVEAIEIAYSSLRRRIGPSPLRDVAFVASMLATNPRPAGEWVEALLEFARETEGVKVSRGRFRREPENIFISEEALTGMSSDA